MVSVEGSGTAVTTSSTPVESLNVKDRPSASAVQTLLVPTRLALCEPVSTTLLKSPLFVPVTLKSA